MNVFTHETSYGKAAINYPSFYMNIEPFVLKQDNSLSYSEAKVSNEIRDFLQSFCYAHIKRNENMIVTYYLNCLSSHYVKSPHKLKILSA